MTDSSDEETLDVLMLAEDFYPKESGGAFIDWNLAQYLAECGDSVTVVTPRNGPNPSLEHVDGVEIRRPFRSCGPDTHPNSPFGICWRVLFTIILTPYLFYFVRQHDFDVVYSTNHLFHFPAALVSTVFRLAHVSFVGYSPSIQPDVSIMDPLVVVERLNFHFFMGDTALCRTPAVSTLLSKLSNSDVERVDGIVDSTAIRTAIESESGRESLPTRNGDVELVFVGRLVDIKNPTTVTNVVSSLPSKYSLTIVGDGPSQSRVEASIQEAGVSDRVQLAGRLPHDETLRVIYGSDLLLLPSKTESYGAVVFEALSLNTPVLATPVGVLSTIDHPLLTIAELSAFEDVIPTIDLETDDEIDEEILDQFSVDRFTRDVRAELVAVTE